MQIAARTAAWAKSGGGVPTAKDYVQDSAFVFWDGIENAGLGLPHDPLATQITDLSGNENNLPNTNMTIGESGFTINGPSAQVVITPKAYLEMTVELLIDFNENHKNYLHFREEASARGCLLAEGSTKNGLKSYYIPWRQITEGRNIENPQLGTRLVTFRWKDGFQDLYYDAENVASGTSVIDSTRNTLTWLYLNTYNGSIETPITYRRVTLHDAYLSDEQIAENYAIDKARFNLT